jgi:hypothetical protein
MHSTRRLISLAVTATAAVALALPPSASAEELNCAFEGQLSAHPGFMLVGGSGQYELTAEANCSLNGAPRERTWFESHGNFASTVCGTWTWFSRDPHLGGEGSLPDFTTIDVPLTPAQDIENMSYHIDFRADHGTIEIHSVDDTDNNDTGTADDEADTLPLNGHVTISPERCTNGGSFTVRGAIFASW